MNKSFQSQLVFCRSRFYLAPGFLRLFVVWSLTVEKRLPSWPRDKIHHFCGNKGPWTATCIIYQIAKTLKTQKQYFWQRASLHSMYCSCSCSCALRNWPNHCLKTGFLWNPRHVHTKIVHHLWCISPLSTIYYLYQSDIMIPITKFK